MNKLRVLFFFGLLGLVILIARLNSRPTSRSESPAFTPPPAVVAATPSPAPAASAAPIVAQATPTPLPSAPPSAALQKIAEHVAPGVVLISVFDRSGKFLRTGAGFFISQDGRFVTTSATAKDAANAVAKASDGRIINVSGILVDAASLDLAVLKADTKKGVPFLSPNKSAKTEVGTPIAVVQSPLIRRKSAPVQGTISARRSDQTGEWLELSVAIPDECIGAPVVNEKGEILGLVTSQHGQGNGTNVVRVASTLEAVATKIDPKASVNWAARDGQIPAEGPTPSPPPKRFAEIPVVQADRPGSSKLIYSPKPGYPTAARHSHFPLKGSGRYRVKFASNGQVQAVEVLESTRSETLDNAATDALRKWKAAPGQEWTATVPITFSP